MTQLESILALDATASPPKPGEGVTLLHALRLYCPSEWSELREAWKDDGDQDRRARAFDAGQRALREKLVAGVLDAGGRLDGVHFDWLDRLVWALPLKIFESSTEIALRIAAMEESSIEWSGPPVLGIRVFPTKKIQPRVASATAIRRWIREKRKSGYAWVSNEAARQDAQRELGATVSMTRFAEAKKAVGAR